MSRHTMRWAALRAVLPATLLVLLVVGVGLGGAVLSAFGLAPLVGAPRASVDAFTAVAPDLRSSLLVTLGVAVASTVLAVVIGVTVALAGSRFVRGTALLTVPVPHLIGAAAVGLLLTDLGATGLIGSRWWVAVIAEYAWKESAFVALVVFGTAVARVRTFDDTAAVLGARRLARLRLVTLPLITPAVIASATICFTYVVGSYEVARLLGRPYPEPLPVMAIRLFTSVDLTARPEAAATALVATTIAALSVVVSVALLRRSSAWR